MGNLRKVEFLKRFKTIDLRNHEPFVINKGDVFIAYKCAFCKDYHFRHKISPIAKPPIKLTMSEEELLKNCKILKGV